MANNGDKVTAMAFNFTKSTGKCHVCGKPTRLLIHKDCGLKMDKGERKKKKYSKEYERYLSRL